MDFKRPVSHRSKIILGVSGTLLSFSRYLPATAFVPLFLMWCGAGEEQKT